MSGKKGKQIDEKEEENEGSSRGGEVNPDPNLDEPYSREKKGKILRFALPEVINKEDPDDRSIPGEATTENVFGIRTSPLPFPPASTVSEIMEAMKADVGEEDSDSSIYLETESRVVLANTFVYKPLFDALRRSPTKSQADYNLLMATFLRNLQGVKQAIEDGANVNVIQDRQTSVIIAAENNDKPILKYLVTVENINLNYRNIYGQTALMVALRNRYDDIVKMLIENDADVEIADNMGKTPLHEALFQGKLEIVKLLLKRKTQLQKPDCFGERPIYTCAVKKSNIKLLQYLLNFGASCEYRSRSGLSLLSRVILNSGNLNMVKCLVKGGADVNHQDLFCKRTPLHLASTIQHLPLVQFLLEKGANPNLKTISDLTPFDFALYYRDLAASELLAPITDDPAITADNIKQCLISRLPDYAYAQFLLHNKRKQIEAESEGQSYV